MFTFQKHYPRRLSDNDRRLIHALECRRAHTGRVRACLHIPADREQHYEQLLRAYTLYLHRRFHSHTRPLLVDTHVARSRASNPGFNVRAGSRRYSTRGISTAYNALVLRTHLYGDSHSRDILRSLVATVPDLPGTSLIILGVYDPRSLHPFSSYYSTMRHRRDSVLTLDVTCLPSLPWIAAREAYLAGQALWPKAPPPPPPPRGLSPPPRILPLSPFSNPCRICA